MSSKLDNRRDQIKTAALQCFSQYGFNKTTMDDIAGKIGMKKASLYYYYKNKESVFSEMIDSEVKKFLISSEEQISQYNSAIDKLHHLIKIETDYFQERVAFFDLSVNTILETQPLLTKLTEKYRKQNVALWARVIQEGIDIGEFRDCKATDVADTVRTIFDSIKFREIQLVRIMSATDIDYDKIKKQGRQVLDLIIKGVKKY